MGKMKQLIKQIIKFGIVGILAFIVDAGILYLLTRYLGIHYLLSASISFVIALIFNYVFSMKFVFVKKEEISRKKEFVIFVVLSIIGLLINEVIMLIGVDFANIHFMLTKLLSTAIVMVWNFVSKKIFLEDK
jgi:putative flippase GtrA